MTVDRRAAVQYLHDRHPQVIDAPEGDVDLEALHLEFFWLQGHTCDLMDARADRAVRRCFATMHHLLIHGDRDVRSAVWNDFLIPHLVFHHDLAWAQKRMPQLLADLCDKVREFIKSQGEPSGSAGSGHITP
jgi:hypothetical protein